MSQDGHNAPAVVHFSRPAGRTSKYGLAHLPTIIARPNS